MARHKGGKNIIQGARGLDSSPNNVVGPLEQASCLHPWSASKVRQQMGDSSCTTGPQILSVRDHLVSIGERHGWRGEQSCPGSSLASQPQAGGFPEQGEEKVEECGPSSSAGSQSNLRPQPPHLEHGPNPCLILCGRLSTALGQSRLLPRTTGPCTSHPGYPSASS